MADNDPGGGADLGIPGLEDAVLIDMEIPSGAWSDFTGADLRRTMLGGGWESTVLVDARLDGATAKDTRFSGADMTGATTIGANFTEAQWDNTRCPDGSLSNDNLGVCDV